MGEIFISHASSDAASAARIAEGVRQAGHRIFLDSDREDGIAPGAAWQKTLLRELRLCDAVVFLNSSASQASRWCHSELVIATELGKRVYWLDLAPGLQPHPLLQSLQGIRFETTIEASVQRLTDNLGLDGLSQSTRFKWERGRPPYPGLAAMDVADACVFFGREEEARNLVARVDGPLGQPGGNLVVVMGPSGAGKSSLVRAGLVARLAVPRSGWAVADPFEPGTRPVGRLASRLAALVPGRLTDGECRDRLMNEGIGGVGEWLADHIVPPAQRVLITVDQAEQLATVTPPQDAGEFLAVLGRELGTGSPVTVVMTVRSDRLDEIQRLPVVGPMIHSPFVIAPMSRSQLAAVIEGPAARADLTFAPGLAGRLTEDAVRGSSGEAVDALPILAFTLREMYDRVLHEDRGTFTDADYEMVGRIKGAITRRTEAAESLLPPNSGPILERLLLRFVTLSGDRHPTGRPVLRERLTTAQQAVVEKLEDQRLLTGTGNTVRLAHEQLITAWPRLAQIVADRRSDLLQQARLERQADDWKHGNGELLGRDATATAVSWLGRAEPGTEHSVIIEYICASRRALRRRRIQAVMVLSTIVALAITASVVAVIAGIQRSHAISQSHLAQSQELAAEATNLFSTNAPLAMLLSLQAYERAPTLQARSALIEAAGQPLGALLGEGTNAVESVAFSPNGQILAAGDVGGHVGLWDIATGRRTATLAEGHPVYSVAFSPNGQILAAGDEGGHVGLWDIATGRRTATLAEGGPVVSVAFSPNRQILAAGDDGGHVGLWDTATGRRTATLADSSSAVESVAFTRNGQTLAAGDTGGHVGLWDTASGRRTATLVEGGPVASVAFSPNGQTLAVGDYSGHVGLWDTTSGRRTATLAEGGPVYTVAFSPNGQTLAAGELGGHVGLWDTASGRRTATLAEGRPVYTVAFSPNGQTLAAGDYDGNVALWDTSGGQRTVTLAEGRPIYTVALSPDGQTLATGGPSGDVGLWDVASGRRTAALAEGRPVVGVAFSPDGQALAVGDTGGNIRMWDTASGRRTATLAEGRPVYTVAFSPNGQTLAAGDTGDVGLWDVASGQQTATLAEGAPVDSVAFSPDGRTLAAGDTGGHVGLWDVASSRRTAALPEGGPVASVAFSPDGRTLAVGDTGGNIRMWNTASGRRTTSLAEGGPVHTVTFSPDGQTLAIGDSAGNVVLWDVASGRRTAALPEGGPVYRVAFSSSGQMLAIGDLNGSVALLRQKLWNLTGGFLSRLICREVRRNMTQAQWAANAPGQPYQKTCSAYPYGV